MGTSSGAGTDPTILITLIVIGILVLIAIGVTVSVKHRAERQSGSLEKIEEKLNALESGGAVVRGAEAEGAKAAADEISETDIPAEAEAPETAEETAAEEETEPEEAATSEEAEPAEETAGEEPEPAEDAAAEEGAEAAEEADEEAPAEESAEGEDKDEGLFDEKLFAVDEILPIGDLEVSEKAAEAEAAEQAAADADAGVQTADIDLKGIESAETAEAEGMADERSSSFIRNFDTGQSGHKYSKEELEAQIRI